MRHAAWLLQSLDPTVPFYQVATLNQEVDRSLWAERLLVSLSASFSAFALILSAIGLYGILAYFVTGRRREIGLRLALGAESRHVIWLVARGVVPALGSGLIFGGVLAAPTALWARSLLYGVKPFDARSAALALALLLLIGSFAAAIPAVRALRVDPASTLREE